MNRRLTVLLAAAAGLAAYFAWSDGGKLVERVSGRTPVSPETNLPVVTQTPRTAATDNEVALLNPVSSIAIEALSEMVERPLFNPNRTPAIKSETPESEVVMAGPETTDTGFNPDEFVLQAVASGGADKIALVKSSTTDQVHHLKLGQFISGWRVLEVGERQLTLAKDGHQIQLKLFQTPAPPTPGTESQIPGPTE